MKKYRIRPDLFLGNIGYIIERRNCIIFWSYETRCHSLEQAEKLIKELEEAEENLVK